MKFHGAVGYSSTTEKAKGVWTNDITERTYMGDVLKNIRKWQSGDGLNDDLNVNTRISITADPYAYENLHNIKYVTWMGSKWKVKEIDIRRPRLLLTLGGVYNG